MGYIATGGGFYFLFVYEGFGEDRVRCVNGYFTAASCEDGCVHILVMKGLLILWWNLLIGNGIQAVARSAGTLTAAQNSSKAS